MTSDNTSRAVIFRPSWLGLAGFISVGAVVIGLAGPFGMAVTQPNVLARIAHFFVVSAALTVLTVGIAEALVRWRPQFGLWAIAIGGAIAAVPGAFIVQVSLFVFSPDSLGRVSWFGIFVQTLPMNVVLALLGWRVLGGEFRARRMAEIAKEAGPGLSHRLPPELRSAPILALQAEDHYLRVHTARGEALIHMRIGDAEEILAGEDGVRAHRSFWIARRALKGVERKAGKLTLKLANGLDVPVSRGRIEAVNEWLARAPAESAV